MVKLGELSWVGPSSDEIRKILLVPHVGGRNNLSVHSFNLTNACNPTLATCAQVGEFQPSEGKLVYLSTTYREDVLKRRTCDTSFKREFVSPHFIIINLHLALPEIMGDCHHLR